jgi:DNA-binding transcriptional MerR regulator
MAGRSSKGSERKPSGRVLMSRAAFRMIAGISDVELAVWEREQFIAPVERADTVDEPLYDRSALQRVRLIRTLADELEVNLPGIEVILHLLDQMGR